MKLTKEKAVDIAIELWTWLAETGEESKHNWPGWEIYGGMYMDCPLCDYTSRYSGGICMGCPIKLIVNRNEFKKHLTFECEEKATLGYSKWLDDEATAEDRMKYARQFLNKLKKIKVILEE